MGRGPSSRDQSCFHANQTKLLSDAVLDLCLLFERGYSESAALQLVGNRYQLRERQRLAVMRASASPSKMERRLQKCTNSIAGQELSIDGFNLVILLEAALGGGVIFEGADGCMRDLSSIHGNYRLVSQTAEVIERAGQWLASQQVDAVHWWFDAPVSNSGRLVTLVRELAQKHGWNWTAQTSSHVDKIITETEHISISSDKIILQRCTTWFNLGQELVQRLAPDAWIIRLPHEEERRWLQTLAMGFPFGQIEKEQLD